MDQQVRLPCCNQLPLHPRDQEKTSFWWIRGAGSHALWQYTRGLYGLRNISQHWQRVMDRHLREDALEEDAGAYVDNVVVFNLCFDSHLASLDGVFRMLRRISIKLHPEKTLLCGEAVVFLGHLVSSHGISPVEAKVLAFHAMWWSR